MKILYFGYDLFSPCLELLLKKDDVQIMKIYSFKSDEQFDFNCKVKSLAIQNNIEFTEKKITAEELEEKLKKWQIDAVFCAGYAYKIPTKPLEKIKKINLHPSLLPDYKGPWPMPLLILNGESVSGVTAHIISEKIDEGDIILSEKFKISQDETIFSLEEKIKTCAQTLCQKLFSDLDFYYNNAKPQGKGSYFPEPCESMYTVFKDTPKEKEELLIRAFGRDYLIYSDKNGGQNNVN